MTFHDFDPKPHADRLLDEHRDRVRFTPLRHRETPLSMQQAYAIQEQFVAGLTRQRGCGVAGYKIGLTSSVMQQMCGIDRPIYGSILADSMYPSGQRLDPAAYGRLCVEFEILVKLARPLPPAADLTRDLVAECVEGIAPAIEIVDDRDADYATLDAASLTADNAWSGGAVIGPLQPLPDDLASRVGTVRCDGDLIAEGRAGAVLGHPLEVIIWMARELATNGKSLPVGAVVMTGSIAKTQFVAPGQTWIYAVEGLGQVELRC